MDNKMKSDKLKIGGTDLRKAYSGANLQEIEMDLQFVSSEKEITMRKLCVKCEYNKKYTENAIRRCIHCLNTSYLSFIWKIFYKTKEHLPGFKHIKKRK